MNWRDIKNPKSGGAEVVTQQISKRWVELGHEVTLFTAAFKGGAKEEVLDGVRIIRRGNQATVHLHAFIYYKKNFQGKVDIVIDEINTIPFFTPLYIREKKISYFNQIAKEVWFYEFPPLLSYLGYFIEPYYLKLYRKTPSMVISDSTKKSLVGLGFKNVNIFSMAVNFDEEQKYSQEKRKNFSLIYVGRVVPSKRVDDIINALFFVIHRVPDATLMVVGDGKEGYLNKLKRLIKNLRLEKNVEFYGFVKKEEKFSLMSQAHLLVATSIREGWGLIVNEAGAVKTPSVVYNVPGLVDAVRKGEAGLLTEYNTPWDLAQKILNLKEDRELYRKIQRNALDFAKSLTWEKTAKESLEIVKEAYES